MTEPGLGSGALREAFEKWWDGGEWEIPNEKTLASDAFDAGWYAALSLSSPIEPPAKGKSFYDHVAPDRAAIEKNKVEEPHGERLRAELEDWLDRNGIVSMRLDTQNHCVSVDIAKLPLVIKSVLRLWGSIYVQRDAQPTPQASSEIRERIHALQVHKFGAAGDSWDDVEPTEYFRASDVFAALSPSRQGAAKRVEG